jgi:hypothetical protein
MNFMGKDKVGVVARLQITDRCFAPGKARFAAFTSFLLEKTLTDATEEAERRH